MTNVWSRFARQPMEVDRGCFKLFIRRNVSAAFKKTSALIYAEDETIWRADRNYGFAGTVDQAFLQDFQCVSRSAMSAARF